MTTIDFKRAMQDAKSASFEALPVGDYDIEIVESTALRSSNGKPMIKVQMQVLNGPYQNRRVFNNFVFSPDNAMALSIFFRHMKCLGLDDTFFASLGAVNSLDPVSTALLNRRARITLGIRQWNGEDRNEVNQIKPYTGAPAMPGMPGGPPHPSGGGGVAQPPQQVVVVQPAPTPMPTPVPTPVAHATPATPTAPATPATPSGLDEFRPTPTEVVSVPTQVGSSTFDVPSSVASGTPDTYDPTTPVTQHASPVQAPVAPLPPQAPELPI